MHIQKALTRLTLLLALLAVPASGWQSIPFDSTTASVMQGILEAGPNRSCSPYSNAEEVFPGNFAFRNGDPGEDHLYNAYTYYNNGPERCVQIQLVWTHQDCGNIEIGAGLYLDSFNPADPTENLLAHTFDWNYDFFDVGTGGHPNDYRYSPGYYRAAGIEYHLDNLVFASAVVPALSRIVVVVDSHAQPGDVAHCPIDPGTSSLGLNTWNLDTTPLEIEVHDTSNYEFNPPGGANLTFWVSLSAQFAEPFTIDYGTSNGSATAGADYQTTNGQLTFQPGQTTKLIQVPIVSDLDDETPPPTETMTLTLSNPSSPFVTLAQAVATGTLHDDDNLDGTCHILNYVGGGDLPLGPVGQPYTPGGPVDLEPDGNQQPADDYGWTVLSGALPPGIALSTFAGPDTELWGRLSGTPTQAGTYDFTLQLSCPLGPDPGTDLYEAPFTIVIGPEGPQALLTLADATVVEGNDGFTPALMTLTLSQALSETLPLEVVLFDGSAAVADDDYLQLLSIPQPTEIAAGNAQETFSLDVVGDLTVEMDETFLVQIRTPVEHNVLATATVTILNDDAPIATVDVPALDGTGLTGLALALGGAALWQLRSRRRRSC